MAPGLGLLVRVLDHHHRRVDHRTDGDGNTAQRHDVGVDALITHHDEGDQYADGQRDDRHQRRAQVPEEDAAHQCDDDEFLQQLEAEVLHRAVDQLAAVVGGDDFDTLGQAAFQLFELCVHGGQGFPRVLAAAQDHHPADRFPIPVELCDAPTHFRAELDMRHIAQRDRHAPGAQLQWNLAKILERLQVAGGADHVFGFGQFEYCAASFLVGHADGLDDLGLSDGKAGHPQWIEHDLILLDHATDGRHLGHVGQRDEFVLEEPVLQTA